MRKGIFFLLLLMSCSTELEQKNKEHLNESHKYNKKTDIEIKKLKIKESISIIENPIYSTNDKLKAINNLKAIANINSDIAYYLGKLYETGEWVEISEESARFYYEMSIKSKDNTESQYSLALMLIDGRGGSVDLDFAEELLHHTHAKNHSPSTYALGYLFFIKNNFKRCIEIFTSENFENNEYSDYLLALSLINTDNDIEKALNLIEKSAKKGHGYSHFTLANIYQNGLYGKKKDIDKSYQHYQIAINKNIPNAKFKLLLLIIDNPSLINNNQYNLINELEYAHKNGIKDASFYLAKIYDQGAIVKQDYKKALYWYIQSASYGNNIAMYNLASMYANGDGTNESIEKSHFWLKQSAHYGNKKAIKAIKEIHLDFNN